MDITPPVIVGGTSGKEAFGNHQRVRSPIRNTGDGDLARRRTDTADVIERPEVLRHSCSGRSGSGIVVQSITPVDHVVAAGPLVKPGVLINNSIIAWTEVNGDALSTCPSHRPRHITRGGNPVVRALAGCRGC